MTVILQQTATLLRMKLTAFKAAELYNREGPCSAEANAAKYLEAEAAFETCTNALMTHGGMGYAKEF